MEWWYYPVLIIAGVFIGFLNTLAGSGSLISLPLFIFFGLDPNTANGTNRIALFMQSVSAVSGFKKNDVFEIKEGIFYGIPAVMGAIVGAFIAVETKPHILNYFIGAILLIMLVFLSLNPQRWIISHENNQRTKPKCWQFILFFALGVYAGFLQAAVGFFWIAALVLSAGYNLVKANAVKMFIIMLYMPITAIIFALNGQVDIKYGLLLGIGTIVGARIAVKTSISKGSPFIRYILLLAILASAIKIFFF